MRILFLLAAGFPMIAFGASGPLPGAPAEVAVAPFAVDRENAEALRPVADECLERLVAGLKAKGITVVRQSDLSEKNLAKATPAQWAVLGSLTREGGQFKAELRLLEVKSGDELRSYFNTNKDPAAIVRLGEAAAVRIAGVIQEQKGARKAP